MATFPLTSDIDPGLVKGYTEDGDHKPRLNLSDEDFETLLAKPYDPLWISTYNIQPSILESFLSNETLGRLFKNDDAIKVGDKIYYKGSHETEHGAIEVEKVAKIIGMNKDTTAPYSTYPHVTITHERILQKDLPTCRSPEDILAAFNEVEPKDSLDTVNCWRTLQLRRGSLELGSLHDVRQAWDLWRQVMLFYKVRKAINDYKISSSKEKRADHEQVGSSEGDSGPAMQQNVNPQSSDHINQSFGSQVQDQLPPPASQSVFQPVSQPVYPVQANGSESNNGTSYADRQSPKQSDNAPPRVFRSVYQVRKTFHGGKLLYPWEHEGRPMYPYEYAALASVRDPQDYATLPGCDVAPQDESE